jgi:hypothetical protein
MAAGPGGARLTRRPFSCGTRTQRVALNRRSLVVFAADLVRASAVSAEQAARSRSTHEVLNRRPSTPTPSSSSSLTPPKSPPTPHHSTCAGSNSATTTETAASKPSCAATNSPTPCCGASRRSSTKQTSTTNATTPRSTRPRHRPTRPVHDQHRRTDPHPHRASLRGPLRVLPPSDAARPRTRIARLSPGQSAALADPPGPEGETAVHVELEFALHRHMCPDQRGQPAVVRRRESRRPLGSVEDVLDHEGVDVDHGRLHDVQKQDSPVRRGGWT